MHPHSTLNKPIRFKRLFLLFKFCLTVALITTQNVSAQDLNLSVSVTNQTCPGNGTMSFTVDNISSAPVNYIVYLLPDTTTPIYNNTEPNVTGLVDGDYLVTATQNDNGTTYTDEQEVTIEDETTPLIYNVTSVDTTCGNDGTITINVEEGNPVTYEILTGPTTAGPQASNVFENVPDGTYTVRVTDNCGEGIVKAHTVLSSVTGILIGSPGFPDTELPDCNEITVSHNLNPEVQDIPMALPISITITVYPPGGGAPIVFTQTANGDPAGFAIDEIIPLYYDTDYYYDLEIVDDCGAIYTQNNNLVRQKLTVVGGFDNADCPGKFLFIDVYKYGAPFTVEFLSVPTGFNAEDFNTEHPGPFTDNHVQYGDEETPVPYGIYEIKVSDDCGRNETILLELEELEIETQVTAYNNDCVNNLGKTEILLSGFPITGGNILSGPDEYTETLPFDLSGYVNDEGNIEIGGLPPGTYQFEVFDDCGNTYPAEVVIPEFSSSGIAYNARPDCTPGLGSLRVAAGYALTSVTITEAPDEFSETLPYDASEFISTSGSFYLDELPPGEYVLTASTDCTDDQIVTANIIGYEVTTNDIYETRHCGAFDVTVEHDSNGSAFAKFWLQKKIDTNTWGHPSLGTEYTEGDVPSDDDSRELINNTTTYNIINTGEFRVLKSYRAFGRGTEIKTCIEVLYEFEFYDDLNIIELKNLTCIGNVADVEVTAIGAEPLTYKIIEKDGDSSFIIDNGTNNVFTGLETASYKIRVDDPCGNFDTMEFNVADLPSLVNANTPPNMEVCDEGYDNTETFDLSDQDALILGGQSTDDVVLTYHSSLLDAEINANPIDVIYPQTTGTSTVYARITKVDDVNCYSTTYFNVTVWPTPQLQMQEEWSMCEDSTVTLIADLGYDSYEWSDGTQGRIKTVSEPGEYTVTVQNQYGCEASKTVTVVESLAPRINTLTIEDWTDEENVITVLLENPSPNFEYSIDGVTYQDSNTFTGLTPGEYSVYVRDKYNCGEDEGSVYLLTYPKFFTPNGDGVNERWRIAFSTIAEPNLYTFIYDRYGKLIASFGTESLGWDGTFNGVNLPSTDYWFVVIRENGKEYKGHFSMIR